MRSLLACGLLMVMLFAGCTQADPDADGDNLPSGAERVGWDIQIDYLDRRVAYAVTSDPERFDTDGDGLSDYDEFIRGLDPRKVDTDGDGLTDCQEAVHSNRTECEDPQFKGPDDGGTGTDPTSADSDPGRSQYARTLAFLDETQTIPGGIPRTGDGLSDGDEVLGLTVWVNGRERRVVLDPRNSDTDGDLLDDGAEVLLYGSDPLVFDTDGDGCQDGLDPYPAQQDRYDAGLTSFTLKRDFGGGAEVLIRALLVDHDQYFPAAGETQHFNVGVSADIPASSPASVRAAFCNYSVWDPWTYIEIRAYHRDAENAVELDLTSVQGPPENSRVWWNVRTGALSFERDGFQLPSPMTFEGRDAKVVFAPRVLGV